MTVRVYITRPIDDLDRSVIYDFVERARRDFPGPRFEVIDPMTIGDIEQRDDNSYDNIVYKQLQLLKKCDVVLVDLSIPNHTYIGCVAELVYAHMWQLCTVVYVGSNRIFHRPWLRYHADYVNGDWEEVVQWIHARLH